ncbi:MAG: hypothetical protein K2L64_03245, partial [Ureaplasma sp.]|nr:hypothetical protein [Ureaplasma sp.]
NINVLNKESLSWLVENLEMTKKINPKIDRKISRAMYRFLSWHEYTTKYKILKKFEEENLSANDVIEYWIQVISKVVSSFVNKFSLRKYFKNNYALKWFWACRLIWVIYWNWINLLHPNSSEELQNYYYDRKKKVGLAVLVGLRSYM